MKNEATVEIETSLRNGIALALAAKRHLGASKLPRIFMVRFMLRRQRPRLKSAQERSPLAYRHIENINAFFLLARHFDLPTTYLFETNDLYNARNVPKVLYCIHALRCVTASLIGR